MRFSKVFLISPLSNSRYGGLRVPSGIGYIAQALYENNIEYEYVDMRIGNSMNYFRKRLLVFHPDLIGISMITLGYKKKPERSPLFLILVDIHNGNIIKKTKDWVYPESLIYREIIKWGSYIKIWENRYLMFFAPSRKVTKIYLYDIFHIFKSL